MNKAPPDHDDLDHLRKTLRKIDEDLFNLLIQRTAVVQKIGRYKRLNGLPVLDEAKEQENLLANRAFVKDRLPAAFVDATSAFWAHWARLQQETE